MTNQTDVGSASRTITWNTRHVIGPHGGPYVAMIYGFLAAIAGCDHGPVTPPTAPVHGRVTFQGKPVEGAQVAFYCQKPGARPAVGKTDVDGVYRLSTFTTNDGAMIGQHGVTISKFVFDSNNGGSIQGASGSAPKFLPPPGEQNSLRANTQSALPWKYSDVRQSGLTADVVPDGSEVNFDLSD